MRPFLRGDQDEHRHGHAVGFLERYPGLRNGNIDYLKTQIGNPEGPDVPNKEVRPTRLVAPRRRVFVERLKQAFEDLNCVNRNA